MAAVDRSSRPSSALPDVVQKGRSALPGVRRVASRLAGPCRLHRLQGGSEACRRSPNRPGKRRELLGTQVRRTRQDVCDWRIGPVLVHGMAGRDEDRARPSRHDRRELFHEARLADSGVAFNERQTALLARGTPGADERAEVRGSADERQPPPTIDRRLWRAPQPRHPPWAGGLARRRDLLVYGGRLRERRHGELLVEHPDAVTVPVDGCVAVACTGMQPHQLAVRGFIQRIEAEPALAVGERFGQAALLRSSGAEPRERGREPALGVARLARLPVVELRAVPQREPGHERATVPGGEGLELVEAAGATRGQRGFPGVVSGHPAPQPALLEQVDLETIAGEREAAVLGVQPSVVESRAQHRQRAAQGAHRMRLVRLWPEEIGELGTRRWRHARGQDGQHGDSLARVDLQRLPIDPHVDRSEESDGQRGGHRGMLRLRTPAVVRDAAEHEVTTEHGPASGTSACST